MFRTKFKIWQFYSKMEFRSIKISLLATSFYLQLENLYTSDFQEIKMIGLAVCAPMLIASDQTKTRF